MTQYRSQMFELVLVGGREGETVRLGDCTFVKGVARAKVPAHVQQFFLNRMARSFQAFPKGSPELAAAQAAWAKAKKAVADRAAVEQEKAHGVLGHLVSGPELGPTDPVPGEAGLGEAGKQASPKAGVVEFPVDAGSAAGSVRGPSGDGLQHAGDADESADEARATEPAPGPVNPAVTAAVYKLDPAVDAHWTAEGLPELDAVESAFGSAGLTRIMVEEAAPGWNRSAAIAAKFNQ